MKKDTAKKLLKIFGILFYVGAIITLLLGILLIVVKLPEDVEKQVIEAMGNVDFSGMNPIKFIGVVLAIGGVYSIIQGWSLRRAGKNEKTTLALVLFVIAVIGAVFGLFGTQSIVSSITTFALDALTLYAIIVVRKGASETPKTEKE